jgi:DNA-binding NtrC family response regulator
MAARKRGPQMRFSEDALVMLEAYDWPGNVRELENTLQRACALSNTDVLLPSDIPLGSSGSRFGGAVGNVTRMRDALTTLMHVAVNSPDVELIPWMTKELLKLATRHFDNDADKARKFLGLNGEEITSAASAPLKTVEKKLKKAV